MKELQDMKKYAKHYGLNYEKVLENVIGLMSFYNFALAFEIAKEQIVEGKWEYLRI